MFFTTVYAQLIITIIIIPALAGIMIIVAGGRYQVNMPLY